MIEFLLLLPISGLAVLLMVWNWHCLSPTKEVSFEKSSAELWEEFVKRMRATDTVAIRTVPSRYKVNETEQK